MQATSSRFATYSAATGADGRYAITGLPLDEYEIAFLSTASGLSYANSYYFDAQDPNFGGAVLLADGATRSGVDAQLEPPGAVSGTVTGPLGSAVGGIEVSVRSTRYPESGFALTDAAGRYTVGALPAGTYTVSVETGGLGGTQFAPESYNQRPGSQHPDPVAISVSTTTTGIDIKLHDAGELAGTVTGLNGAPVSGATVRLTDPAGSQTAAWATTGVDGAYTIANLEPGSYIVHVDAPWGSDYLAYAGRMAVVTADDTTQGVDASLAAGGVITGTVTDAAGHPLAGIVATLAPPGFTPVIGAPSQPGVPTDADGHYRIDLLAAGVYRVYFSGGPYVPHYSGAAAVSVTAGTVTAGVDAVMTPGGSIAGTVTDGSGAPLSAVVFAELPDGPTAGIASTDAAGHYVIGNLAPGSYVVFFQANGITPLAQIYDGRTTAGTADTVLVTAGATTSGIDARLTGPLLPPVSPPLPATAAPSTVGVISGLLGVSRTGAVKVGLRCTGPTDCVGMASLSVAEPAATSGRRAARRLTIGSARFHLAPGRPVAVALRLTASGRSILRRHGGRVAARLTVRTAAGARSTTARLSSRR